MPNDKGRLADMVRRPFSFMNTPTPEETLRALQDSIAHWERLATGNRRLSENVGGDDCALCKIFFIGKDFKDVCIGCPVYQKTNLKGCRGTPFTDASIICFNFGLNSPEFKEAAQKELDFLKSLLPKENQTNESNNRTND